MTKAVETFQVSSEAAEVYEARFVPALFAEWAPLIVDAAGVAPGASVLDVACGTGVVAREAADRLAGEGRVVGLDLNEGMLSVARRLHPEIEWRQGDAAALPFDDASFDVVLCQAGLMFFEDRAGALREMARMLTPGGMIAVQVWASLESQPGYGPVVDAAVRHSGPEALDLLSSYWVLGDLDLLASLFEAAGLSIVGLETRTGTARFHSVDELVATEVEGTPLIERIRDDIYEAIRQDSRRSLASFVTGAGAEIPIVGHILTARRKEGI